MDKGPWFFPTYQLNDGPNEGSIDAENDMDCIESDDSTHDATLRVSGDFANNAERRKYLEFIADELNSCATLRLEAFAGNADGQGGGGRQAERGGSADWRDAEGPGRTLQPHPVIRAHDKNPPGPCVSA